MPQGRYGNDPEQSDRTLQIFEAGRYFYANKLLLAVLVSEADKVTPTSYKKIISQVSSPYEFITVHDNISTILEDGIKNTISNDRETRAPVAKNSHDVSTYHDYISKNKSRTQNAEKPQADNNEHVVNIIIRDVIKISLTKYVVLLYGYAPEEHPAENSLHLSTYFVVGYCQLLKCLCRRKSTLNHVLDTKN